MVGFEVRGQYLELLFKKFTNELNFFANFFQKNHKNIHQSNRKL